MNKMVSTKFNISNCVVTTNEGLPVFGPSETQTETLSAMFPILSASIDKVLNSLFQKNLREAVIKTNRGMLIIEMINQDLALFVASKRKTAAGLLLNYLRKKAKKISEYYMEAQKTKV